jgi:capsular polysaccharide biosynthesis protein
VCKFGKSLKAITLDRNKNYLFIYSPWFGYFSWVTESLPRILEVRGRHKELTLILPESYSKLSFVTNSLELFPELKHEIIPEGINMKIPKVVIPELKPFTYTFDANTMQNYRAQMWAYIDRMQIDIPTFEKIYVSRKTAKNRKLLNEKEVLDLLNGHGFQEIAFENHSFFEQIYLMKNCKVLTGVHGAGFANIAFMADNTVLIELIKEYSSYKEERPSYWRLCSALNIDYYIEYCKPERYRNYDLWIGVNLTADIDEFAQTLEQIKQ